MRRFKVEGGSVLMVQHVVLVLACVLARAFQTEGIKDVDRRYLENLLLDGSLGQAECDVALQAATDADRNCLVDTIPQLKGQWVSQRCEIQPGPRYIIRSLTFFGNLSFKYVVYNYGDSSCTSPTYSLAIEGLLNLQNPSSTTAGASQGRIAVSRALIIPHSEVDANKLSKLVNKKCPGFINRRWKRRREYVLFHAHREGKTCRQLFAGDLNDVTLLKTQTRLVEGRRTKELLTGTEINGPFLPVLDAKSLFNPPLLHSDQRHGCSICHAIGRGTEHSPPILMALPRLPPYLVGEWVSQRCEALPLGAFLTRRLTFGPGENSWALESSYHSDAKCSVLSFIVNAAGIFSKGGANDKSILVDGAYNLDWTMLRVRVTVKDRNLRTTLDRTGCGNWNSEEVNSSCSPLGVTVPSKTYSIAGFEIDQQGSPLLFLGVTTELGKRATSFQPPLVQCSSMPSFPMPLALHQVASSSEKHSAPSWALIAYIIVHYFCFK